MAMGTSRMAIARRSRVAQVVVRAVALAVAAGVDAVVRASWVQAPGDQ